MTISVHDAIKSAQAFLTTIYPEARQVTVEELDNDDQAGEWLITLGFAREIENQQSLGILLRGLGGRSYKTIAIDKGTGDIKSMKIKAVVGQV